MTAWQEQLEATKEYEALLGDGNPMGAATLALHLAPDVIVPFTHTKLVEDFELDNGKSSTSFIERGEFRVELIPQNSLSFVKKGLLCTLRINQNSSPFEMQLWHGGLQPGGLIFRFMLVSAAYRG